MYQLLSRLFSPIRDLLLAPEKILAWPRKILQLSLPAGIALVVAVFLVVCVAAACVVATNLSPDVPALRPWRNRFPLIVLMVVVIPIVTYYAARLWLEGGASAFEDIDRAWQAGLAELERNGLNLRQIPIFLLLGTQSEQQERGVFQATRLELTISGFPAGGSALRWYANADGIYLVCTEVGCLSRLGALARVKADQDSQQQKAAPSKARDMSATISVDEDQQLRSAVANLRSMSAQGAPHADITGTMMLDPMLTPSVLFRGDQKPGAARPAPLTVSRDEIEVQSQRLKHLCRLLRRARRPLCPINGAVALLPYDLILSADWGAAEVRKATKADLAVLSEHLQLRFPVTALVAGIESEKGFHEFVTRVGRARAVAQRFGKGFDLWSDPVSQQVSLLCDHACAAFESWIYHLFQEQGALERPGNRALYMLLCRVRRYLHPRLAGILVDAFGHETSETKQAQPLLFGGCYFAATGEVPEQQGFVKNVFDRLPEQQEELQWTPNALREDHFYRRLAYVAFGLDGLLLAALVAFVATRWWR